MNLDDRLRHAFSNLENRVNTELETRTPGRHRARRRVSRALIPVVAALAVIVVIGGVSLLGGDQPEPVPPATDRPTTTESETSTSTSQTTTSVVAPGVATSIVVANADGVFELTNNGLEQVSPTPARKAYLVAPGEFVVLTSQEILYESDGEQTPIARAEPEGYVDLFGVFETERGTEIAYEVGPTPDPDDIESHGSWLEIYNLDTGEKTRGGRIDGYESDGSVTSYANGRWIVDVGGEGFRWHFAYDAETLERIQPDDPLKTDCPIDEPGCPLYTTRVADPDVWVYLEHTGGDQPTSIVIVDGDVGDAAFTGRIDVGTGTVTGFDVLWPYATVDMEGGPSMLVNLEDGSVDVLPISGTSSPAG